MIKRTVLFLIFFTISLANLFAQSTFYVGNVKYNITSIKTVSVAGLSSGYSANMIIPDIVLYNGIEYKVTSIERWAFSGYRELTSINIPSSVTTIGSEAFRGCSGLTSIIVDSNNAKYDSRENCNAIIETGTNTLIVGCNETVIPSSVTSIAMNAFYDCSGLTSINIPSSVTSIGNHAFSGCSGLTSIIVDSNNAKYDSHENCNAIIETGTNTLIVGCKETVIPSSVTAIGSDAFRYCSGLTSIEIPASVTSIGDFAFYFCNKLTSIIFPSSVTTIGSDAFCGCRGLTSINIPSSVTAIGSNAFCYCSGLTSINIPSSVTAIGSDAFRGCSGLTSIEIPSSVTSIGGSAFSDCSGLTTINIPEGVTAIGSDAFRGCSGLTSIEIPSSVTSIGGSAFYGCSGLTTINIPEGVTNIGNYTFYGCSGLTSIIIPSSVTNIGYGAFSYDTGLKYITLYSSPPSTYNLGYYDAILFVPSNLIEEYKSHSEWRKFKYIKPIGSSTEIEITFSDEGYSTFYDSQYSYELPPELIAFAIKGISDGKLLFDTIADGSKGEVLPAATAALLKSDNPEYISKLTLSTSSNLYHGINLLMGSDYETTTYTNSGKISFFYKLSYGPSESDLYKELGWYWGARDGDVFLIEAHKAWLAVPVMPQTKGSHGFSLSGEPTIDKEDKTDFLDSEEILFDLNGRSILTPLKNNVIFINGKKKIILR